ncbi:MAG: right-handed parallel beta-helix repeat-containing protein, partial [Anaerolineales bacterium]|nr:right-handed parallel beta-helix repeat-containing protein [Anaerolineales bacterium]
GIYLTVNGSKLTIEDSQFTNNTASDNGGGLYVVLQNGSQMVIDNSWFTDNDAPFGGAIEIHVDETSELLIKNSHFASNRTTLTSGSGGAGHLVIQGGTVNIMDTVFDDNRAGKIGGGLYVEMQGGSLMIKSTLFANNESTTSPGTAGSGLYVENSGAEDATLHLVNTTFTNNIGAPQFQTSQTGAGVLNTTNYDQQVFVPLNTNMATPSLEYARILSVELDSNYNYLIHFDTNFTPNTAATHLHFFFDTVAQDQAGIPASPSNWKLYGGASPFTGYSFRDRPFTATGAEKICVLVANADHSIRLDTGNCVKLP